MSTPPNPRIIVLTAPSGAGKTTIAHRLIDAVDGLRFSVSMTTRPARSYERNGRDYLFVSEDDFRQKIHQGELLEYEEVYPGRFYGTPRQEVDRATPEAPVLLDVDVKGAHNIKLVYDNDALTIFIQPPSLEVLAERLVNRKTETEDDLTERLQRADMEMRQANTFDAVVVNDDLDEAVTETLRLVRAFLRRKA